MSNEIHDEPPARPMTEQEREDGLRVQALHFATKHDVTVEEPEFTVVRAARYLKFLKGERA